eukprot:3295524-Amphidinium_carterae.1
MCVSDRHAVRFVQQFASAFLLFCAALIAVNQMKTVPTVRGLVYGRAAAVKALYKLLLQNQLVQALAAGLVPLHVNHCVQVSAALVFIWQQQALFR